MDEQAQSKPKAEPIVLVHHQDFVKDCPYRQSGWATASSRSTTCKHCLAKLQSRGDP